MPLCDIQALREWLGAISAWMRVSNSCVGHFLVFSHLLWHEFYSNNCDGYRVLGTVFWPSCCHCV